MLFYKSLTFKHFSIVAQNINDITNAKLKSMPAQQKILYKESLKILRCTRCCQNQA